MASLYLFRLAGRLFHPLFVVGRTLSLHKDKSSWCPPGVFHHLCGRGAMLSDDKAAARRKDTAHIVSEDGYGPVGRDRIAIPYDSDMGLVGPGILYDVSVVDVWFVALVYRLLAYFNGLVRLVVGQPKDKAPQVSRLGVYLFGLGPGVVYASTG